MSPLHTRAKDRIPQPAPSPGSSLHPRHDQHGEERELSSPEVFSDDCEEEMDDDGTSPEIFSFSDDCDENLHDSASFRMDDGATSPSTPPQDSYASENVSSESNDTFYADLAEPFNDDGTLTRGDAYMMLLDVAVKYGLSWTVIEAIQKFFNNLLDSPARAAMQHMMQFNGYFGCSWCYHPGNNVDGTVKYCLSEPHPDRTDEELVADMTAACHTGSTVKGVKGPSPLINLPGFSPVWSWCPDYMHCVLLGVSRQITELWLSECGMDYYCGSPSTMKVINERLLSINMPECISRQPRALTVRKYWKASEWQYWLLYYSMPCLSNVLPKKYLEHWGLLVKGMFLLLKDSVSLLDIEHSARFLTEFVVGVEFLYGQKNMTYNVHQLLHIPKSVVLFGPLWAHSCFSFEVNMGKLLRLVSSSNGVALQIATRLLLHSSLFALKALATDYALSLIEAKSKKIVGKIVPLGNGEAVSNSFLRAHSALLGFEAVEYKRINVSGAIITSEKYIRHMGINSTAVILADGTYAKVKRIFCCRHGSTERFCIMSNVYSVNALMPTEHINIAKQQYERLFEIDEHARPCIYFAFGSEELFCNLINSYEWS
ncbi:uncharacterized protein [Dermacentor albipictus]|uniref:uncharacterized protein n=1 Tax=Dermacentor albipictus TaxID=60249 RepID=UPI0038FCF1B6